MRTWLTLAGLLLVAPLVGASADGAEPASTPVALYFHVINVQDMPINTQEPNPSWTDDGIWGPSAFTLTCLDDVNTMTGVPNGLTAQAFSTARGYSTPTLVDYARANVDGFPRTHPERGLAGDVNIDPAVPVALTWYLALDGEVQDVSAPAAPAPIANVRVRATLRTGDAISVDESAYDQGHLLAEGTSPAVTLVADQVIPGPEGDGGVRALGQVEDRWVYEVKVPLHLSDPVIPRAGGYNVRVDVFQDNPRCQDLDNGAVLLSPLGPFTGAGTRPRLELAVRDAFEVAYGDAKWIGDDLVLFLGANSVWGEADLDFAAMTIETAGPSEAGFVLQPILTRYHEHGRNHATEPYAFAWVWPGANETASNGHYEATVRIPNLQHTATLEARIAFEKTVAQEAPGAATSLLVLGLAALAMLARHRARPPHSGRP